MPEMTDAEVKRRRAIIVVAIFLLAGIIGWMMKPQFLEVRIGGKDKAYTGCYQAGASTVRLSAQGILHTSDGNWPYRIEHGEKGAAMLAVDEIGIAPNGSGYRFSRIAPGSKGIREPIAPGKGFRIGQTDFAKVPCKGKGVHSS